MNHLMREDFRLLLSSEKGHRDSESAIEHLIACRSCRGQAGAVLDELRAKNPKLRIEGPSRLVSDLIDRGRRWALDALRAQAEWAELRSLSSRRSQRDRVRLSRACHTTAFLNLLLQEIRASQSSDDAEFWAALAFLSLEAMNQRGLISSVDKSDRTAEIWAAVANSRRLAAEWKRARQALANANRYVEEGSSDPYLRACVLSIFASLQTDEGHRRESLETLDKCQAIYEGLAEWPLTARILVQRANVLEPIDPLEGLKSLDRARPLIPVDDSYLWLLESILRAECLIGAGRHVEALEGFQGCFVLLRHYSGARLKLRVDFVAARLLDAFGFKPQSDRLFEWIIDRDVENELYKDALLDLLFLYEHHTKSGDFEKAARTCRRALTEPSLSAIMHDQMRDLWGQLLETTQTHAISRDLLGTLRQYFSAHWRHPAAVPPSITASR